MCGISGILTKESNSSREKLRKDLIKINDTLNHRGPDDSELWINETKGIGLGHKRLSILDPTTNGRQPFTSSSGKFKIVFNGEIYNYLELKKQISQNNKNIKWKSNSDTEVLIEAIDLWGIEETLTKISGMFSFAVWNEKNHTLTLVRDKFGIKPLYYGYVDDVLLFSSELKGIKAYALNKLKISKEALNNFLRFSYIPNPLTIYENIYQLRPAHMINFGRSQINTEVEYWNFNNIAESSKNARLILNDCDAADHMENIISDSVKSHMVSDVKIGSFLSGGIDSTLVTTMMQKNSSVPIDTFSIGFETDIFDESKYANTIAKELKTNHHEYILKSKDLEDSILSLPSIFDEPFADSSSLPTLLLCQKTSGNVKVALSGDGGDEMFGGYNRYIYANKVWKFITSRSNFEKKALSLFLNLQSENFINKFSMIYSHTFKTLKLQNYGQTLKKIPRLLSSKTKSELFNNIISIINSPNKFLIKEMQCSKSNYTNKLNEKFEFIEQMMLCDIRNYLVNDILCKVDRTSMHNSLEVRVPLINENIFNASFRLPLSKKINNKGDGKIILKKILSKYLDLKVFDRPKMGFGIPIDLWIRSDLKNLVNEFLLNNNSSSSGLLNHKFINQLIKEHNKGKNLGSEIWNLLIFEIWHSSQQKTI